MHVVLKHPFFQDALYELLACLLHPIITIDFKVDCTQHAHTSIQSKAQIERFIMEGHDVHSQAQPHLR